MIYIILFLVIVLCVLLLVFLFSLVWTTVVGGIPYLGTDAYRIEQMLHLAQVKKGEKAVDLGSGDGRIVIALAKAGAEAHGYELNLFYVLVSRWKVQKEGLQNKAFIHWKNFFLVDLSSYSLVMCYCISYTMNKLERKLRKELPVGARVVATSYKFKTWEYNKHLDYAFLYKKTKKIPRP